jgi:hypothetical protein
VSLHSIQKEQYHKGRKIRHAKNHRHGGKTMKACHGRVSTGNSNVELGLPAFGGAKDDQGISNDGVKSFLLFPSAFVI